MIHQIPELGVIAIGNQIGRVALLTLTRSPPISRHHRHHHHWRKIPLAFEANADDADDEHHHHTGFKIEAVLPFESQEKRLVRPEVPLFGMAVSPIRGQGRGRVGGAFDDGTGTGTGAGTGGRYRLLMTYYDDTVLSYEISRGVPEGELLVL